MSYRAAIVTLVALLCSGSSIGASSTPSDSEMTDIINEGMNLSCRVIGVGEFKVLHSGATNWRERVVSPATFSELKVWADLGLIQLGIQQLPLASAMVSGIDGNIRVVPTEKGKSAHDAANCKFAKHPAFLTVQSDPSRVETLVSNEEVKKGVDTYRLVKTVEVTTNRELGRQIFERMGNQFHSKMKVIRLYKFDPFSKAWKFVALDAAGSDSEITSNRVAKYLAEIP